MFSKRSAQRFLFPQKTVKQAGVLPFVFIGDDMRFLLVTSRRRGRWTIPKGWPIEGSALSFSAMIEALEEAGLEGLVAPNAIGSYMYPKNMRGGYSLNCHVTVYPMLVSQQFLDWPEKGEREVRWFDVEEVEQCVDDAGVGQLIRDFSERSPEQRSQLFDETNDASRHYSTKSITKTLASIVGF